MAQLKAHEVEAYLKKLDKRYSVYLIYGPDTGLVSERADAIAALSGVDLSDPFSYLRMDGDALPVPSAVVEEAHTVSMFGGRRLIRFKTGSLRNAADVIKPLNDTPPDEACVVIEAGELNKSHGLRKLVEAMPHGLALPCYQDESQALDGLIDAELVRHGMQIDRATREYLRGFLGGDRRASRNELQKLALYCQGQSSVGKQDIDAVIGDVAANAVDEIVDAAALGALSKLEVSFARFSSAGMPAFLVLSAALRHFQMLHQMRREHEASRKSVRDLVASARPPIYFKRRQAVSNVLMSWRGVDLLAACNRLSEAIASGRQSPSLELEITRSAIMAIGVMARQKR